MNGLQQGTTEARRSTLTYLVTTSMVVVLSWLLHELAHYLMGRTLGYSMIMTLNSTYPVDDTATIVDGIFISAAGPLFTIAQALGGYYLLRRFRDKRLYALVFVPFYMRLLALVVSFHNPNDEARISYDVGIGMLTLPVVVCALLMYLVYLASIEHRYTSRFQGVTAIVTLLVSSCLILLDQSLHIVLLG